MIYTSNYRSVSSNEFNPISISWDKGKDFGYSGDYISLLAPKLSFWREWKNNRGIISDEENRYYILEYYKQVLSLLDPGEIYNIVNNKVMLCYEDNMDFCHRHIVSAWLELFLDIDTFEVIEDEGKLKVVDRPKWIKDVLEDVIRNNMDMHGFNSIRAAYLYNLSNKFNNFDLSSLLLYEASDIEDSYVLVKK